MSRTGASFINRFRFEAVEFTERATRVPLPPGTGGRIGRVSRKTDRPTQTSVSEPAMAGLGMLAQLLQELYRFLACRYIVTLRCSSQIFHRGLGIA